MKKSLLIAASLMLCTGNLMAQPKASEPRLLIKSSQSLMAPVWSPDGKKIAVTGDNYIGIWVANADGSDLKQVSDELGAGYKMSWLNNSTIVSTPYTVVNDRRMTSIEQVNVETGKVTEVAAAEHNFKRSKAAVKTNKYYKLMVDDPAGATSQIPVLKDYAGRMIINPQLSHDGTMIAFQIVGKGIFMIDDKATMALFVDKGSYPQFTNKDSNVAFVKLEDDGANFTKGEIYSFDIVKRKISKIDIHRDDLLPVTLAADYDGSAIAFENDKDGYIYLIDLTY